MPHYLINFIYLLICLMKSIDCDKIYCMLHTIQLYTYDIISQREATTNYNIFQIEILFPINISNIPNKNGRN